MRRALGWLLIVLAGWSLLLGAAFAAMSLYRVIGQGERPDASGWVALALLLTLFLLGGYGLFRWGWDMAHPVRKTNGAAA